MSVDCFGSIGKHFRLLGIFAPHKSIASVGRYCNAYSVIAHRNALEFFFTSEVEYREGAVFHPISDQCGRSIGGKLDPDGHTLTKESFLRLPGFCVNDGYTTSGLVECPQYITIGCKGHTFYALTRRDLLN